jgi:hypothetical protein
MAEKLELEFVPAILRLETTLTGAQDTAIYPTLSGHLPDTETTTTTFF